jgi:hypothetical protein
VDPSLGAFNRNVFEPVVFGPEVLFSTIVHEPVSPPHVGLFVKSPSLKESTICPDAVVFITTMLEIRSQKPIFFISPSL